MWVDYWGGGGAKGMLPPRPLKLLEGDLPSAPPPLPTAMMCLLGFYSSYKSNKPDPPPSFFLFMNISKWRVTYKVVFDDNSENSFLIFSRKRSL